MVHSACLRHDCYVKGLDSQALKNLAEAVRRARRAAGLTQEAVAFEASISVRHYQELESGRLNPSYTTLRAVAAAMGTTLARVIKMADGY